MYSWRKWLMYLHSEKNELAPRAATKVLPSWCVIHSRWQRYLVDQLTDTKLVIFTSYFHNFAKYYKMFQNSTNGHNFETVRHRLKGFFSRLFRMKLLTQKAQDIWPAAGQIAYKLYDRPNFVSGQTCFVTGQISGSVRTHGWPVIALNSFSQYVRAKWCS